MSDTQSTCPEARSSAAKKKNDRCVTVTAATHVRWKKQNTNDQIHKLRHTHPSDQLVDNTEMAAPAPPKLAWSPASVFAAPHLEKTPPRVLLYGQRGAGNTNSLNVLRRAAQASGKFASFVLVDPCPDNAATVKDGWAKIFASEYEALQALAPRSSAAADADDWSLVDELPGPIFVGIDNGSWKLQRSKDFSDKHRVLAEPPLAELWSRSDLAIVTTTTDYMTGLIPLLKPQVTCVTATWINWAASRTKLFQEWCTGPPSKSSPFSSPFGRFVFARPGQLTQDTTASSFSSSSSQLEWLTSSVDVWLPEFRTPGVVPLYWTSWWTTREAYHNLADDLPFPVWLSGEAYCDCSVLHTSEQEADEEWQCPNDRFSLVAEVRAESEAAVWEQVRSICRVDELRFCNLTGPDYKRSDRWQ
jgi:hypothetical protein